MRSLHHYILPFVLILFFSSCVTFEEKYYFNEDGSGKMSFTIDYTEYAKVIHGLDGMKEEMVNTEFNSMIPVLEKIIGISDVEVFRVDSFVESLSFSFSSNGSLNEALCVVHEYPGNSIHSFFISKGKKLYYNRSNYGTDLSDKTDSESTESRDVLESMEYNIIIETQKEIRKIKIKDPRAVLISEKSKAVISTNFYNIDTNNKSLDFLLKFK